MSYQVRLEVFEGPLDLLLHLIKKDELNIYDIPISTITQQYFEYIDLMKELNLDIAGEYILMAATLTHIKSKMLLPQEEKVGEEEETEDPRAELVRRLLEYRKFKEAAEDLCEREDIWRDVFYPKHEVSSEFEEEEVMLDVGIFDLIDAFKEIIQRMPDNKTSIDIIPEELTVRGRMSALIERLDVTGPEGLTLWALLEGDTTRRAIVVTFLALLELAKLHLIRLLQIEGDDTLRICRISSNDEAGEAEGGEAEGGDTDDKETD